MAVIEQVQPTPACLRVRCDRTCGEWHPGDGCPCRREECKRKPSFKLTKAGHGYKVCTCRSCIGRRGSQGGHRKQGRVLKDMATASGVRMDRAPGNEESARFPWWHIESKSGSSLPKALTGTFVRQAERQAELAAEGVSPGWAVVFTLEDGSRRVWCDFDDFLRFIREKGEDA